MTERSVFHSLLVSGVILATSGCALLPGSLQVAALAGSGVSLVTTGKTLSDHALSTVTDQDCRVLRVVNGETICVDTSPAGIASRPPGRVVGEYAVIGSFRSAENAQRLGDRYREYAPQVIAVESGPSTLYRVAIGPLAATSKTMVLDQLQLAGISNAWTMSICPDGQSRRQCDEQTVAAL